MIPLKRRTIYNGGVSELSRPRCARPSEAFHSTVSPASDLLKLAELCDDPECNRIIGQLREMLKGSGDIPAELLSQPHYLALLHKLENLIAKKNSKGMVAE